MASTILNMDDEDNNKSTSEDLFGGSSSLNNQEPESATGEISTDGNTVYGSEGGYVGQSNQVQSTQDLAGQGGRSAGPNAAPSSGTFTNVSDFIDRNKQSTQRMGQTVSNKLQSSADLARQNLQNVQDRFGQQMDQGTIQNMDTAASEFQSGVESAANQSAATKHTFDNTAFMYNPAGQSNISSMQTDETNQPSNFVQQFTSSSSPDEIQQFLLQDPQGQFEFSDIDPDAVRVMKRDGTFEDFNTQSEATKFLEEWNKANPTFNIYGEEADLGITDQRMADILNAEYFGPEELFQIQGFTDSVRDFSDIGALQGLAQNQDSKTALLDRVFGRTAQGENYTQGQKLLDNLLLGQSDVANQLQDTASNLFGEDVKASDFFQQAQRDVSSEALRRSQELDQIRTDAREFLNKTALGKDDEIQARLKEVEENWDKLPNHFREKFKSEIERHNNIVKEKSNYEKQISGLEKQIDTLNNQILNDQVYIMRQSNQHSPNSTIYQRERIARNMNQINEIKGSIGNLKSEMDTKGLTNYNPKSFSLTLDAAEAQILGIRGGEGFYNLLTDPNRSVDDLINDLIKIGTFNREEQISRDEQSQLARLQSIAELASGYGTEESGIDFRNQFTNRDLAGTKSAADALDVDNFRRRVGTAEDDFRKDAKAKTINVQGYGTKWTGGWNSRQKKATKNISQNMGEIFDEVGYRNRIADGSSSTDEFNNLLKDIQSFANFTPDQITGEDSWGGTGDLMLQTGDLVGTAGRFIDDITGLVGVKGLASGAVKALQGITGDSKGAQREAERKAQIDAVNKYNRAKDAWIESSGVLNEFRVSPEDITQDNALIQLIKSLDLTNLG